MNRDRTTEFCERYNKHIGIYDIKKKRILLRTVEE